MAAFGFWGLARGSSMGNDEDATMWAARDLSLHQLGRLLRHVDAVHGLYYLIIHGWTRLGPGSPAYLRIPSVLALMASAALIVLLGRRLTGSWWVGSLAGLLMALTPSVSYYAQTARSYAMVHLTVLAATLLLVLAIHAEARGERAAHLWVGYAALVTLAGYLNEISLAALAAHAVTVVRSRVDGRTVLHWFAAGGIAAALVAPLVRVTMRQAGQVGWLRRPGWNAIGPVYHGYFGDSGVVAALLAGLAVLGAVAWRGRTAEAASRARVTLPSVALPLLLGPAAVVAVASWTVRPLFGFRYLFFAEPGAALLSAGGVVAVARYLDRYVDRYAGRAQVLRWVPAVVVCACVLLVQLGVQQEQRQPDSRDGAGPAAAYIALYSRRGDGLVLLGAFFRKIELAYRPQFRNVTDIGLLRSPAQVGDFRGTDRTFRAARPLVLARRRVWALGDYPLRMHVPDGPLGREYRLLIRRFRLVRSVRFTKLQVQLWERRGTPPERL